MVVDAIQWTMENNSTPIVPRQKQIPSLAGMVTEPSVIFNDEKGHFEMWFSSLSEAPQTLTSLYLYYCQSEDGVHWTNYKKVLIPHDKRIAIDSSFLVKSGLIDKQTEEIEFVSFSAPSVIFKDAKYYIYGQLEVIVKKLGRKKLMRAIGLATTPNPEAINHIQIVYAEKEFVGGPSGLLEGDRLLLFFSSDAGNIHLLESKDMVTFQLVKRNLIAHKNIKEQFIEKWRLKMVYEPGVIKVGEHYKVFYGLFYTNPQSTIPFIGGIRSTEFHKSELGEEKTSQRLGWGNI